jgi:hypothetical protein
MKAFAKVIGAVILLLITWCLLCLAVALTGTVLP